METEKTYCKIVIIDDEYIMRQGIKNMIEWEKEGYKIVGEASDGQEGLQVVEETQPDIVFADIVMPIIDGIEFSAIMKQRFPKIRLIILSSFDKFEYVKETLLNGAFDYVLKPSLNPEILLHSLQKAVDSIPNIHLQKDEELSLTEKLSRYLNGYDMELTEYNFHSHFPHTKFRLLCSNQGAFSDGYKSMENEVSRVIKQFFEGKPNYITEILWIGKGICCIIINYRMKEEESLRNDIEECVQKIQAYQPETFWVYGKDFQKLDELKGCYAKVCEGTESRFHFKGVSVLDEEKCYAGKVEEKFDYEEYTALLKYQNFSKALMLLKAHINTLSEKGAEEYLLKNVTKNLIYNFIVEWEKLGYKSSSKKTVYFRELDHCIYAEDFLEVFHRIISEFMVESDYISEGENGNIAEISRYIREHYMENLDLVNLAKQFNYNYNYLSTYFNQQIQEGFSGYLNKLRIEKACEMLKTTQFSIAQVSSMVGYSDHSYFCRVFKNIMGKTPSAWRRKSIIDEKNTN